MSGKQSPIEPSWSTTLLFLAAEEAARSLHGAIEPAHLLIAVCRLADAEAQNLTQAEQAGRQRLRAELEALAIEPRPFRRQLRSIIPGGGEANASDQLKAAITRGVGTHAAVPGILSGVACSPAARNAIQRAAALAGPSNSPEARHLLRALLLGETSGSASATDDLPDRL